MLDPAGCPLRRALAVFSAVTIVAVGISGAEEGINRSPKPIVVVAGRADFDVVTPSLGAKSLLIVSALSHEAGPFPITLTATSRTTASVRPPPIAIDPSTSAMLVSQAPSSSPVPPATTSACPGRKFHLLVRDGDVASAGNYLAVDARLAAVGMRVQVYVDLRDSTEVDPALLREIVSTFDERVYPLATKRFGPAEDVDGDGRFTIFVSSWLSRLAGGRIKVDGFMRGADFDVELSEPFGNRCDMMYLSAALRPGPHLKTVLAHEYTHAVRFSRKAFPRDIEGRLGVEEEGWLDEGLAHLVEDLHGFSRSNLDYRISAFLSRPERYRLVVDDYYSADLFRSHGNRGGTYLFLRWCVDRLGEDVLDRMMRSPLGGVKNLESATGRSFASLYRDWTIALFLSGLEPGSDLTEPGRYRTLDPRGLIDDWILAGPRSVRVKPDGPVDTWSAAGTSTHFAVIDGATSGAVRLEVVGTAASELQVTVVPLPENLGGLDLDVRSTAGPEGVVSVRAIVASRGETPIRLGAIGWEPLVPANDARASLFRKAGLDRDGIAERFGTTRLAFGDRLASRPITLEGVQPGDGPLVFKVIGTDGEGRRVAAWADVEFSAKESFEAGDASSRR